MDSNQSRARAKARRKADQAKALRSLAEALNRLDAAQQRLDAAQRRADEALVAAMNLHTLSDDVRGLLGLAPATFWRRVRQHARRSRSQQRPRAQKGRNVGNPNRPRRAGPLDQGHADRPRGGLKTGPADAVLNLAMDEAGFPTLEELNYQEEGRDDPTKWKHVIDYAAIGKSDLPRRLHHPDCPHTDRGQQFRLATPPYFAPCPSASTAR